MKREVKKNSLTPSNLYIGLIIALSLIALLHIGAIVLGYQLLKETSVSVTSAVNKSDQLSKEISRLQLTEATLKKKEETVKLSKQLASEVKDYTYQKQIIHDAIAYGSRVGVSIKGFTFADAAAGTSTGGTAAAKKAPGTTVGTVTAHPVIISLDPEINYLSFLQLLKYLEGNLTQTHLASVALSISQEDPKSIETQALNLEVYTKK